MDEQPINPSDLPGEPSQDTTHQQFQAPKQRSGKKIIYIIVALVVILAAVGGYMLLKKSPAKTPAAQTGKASSQASNVPATASASDTKNYKSSVSGLDLSFDYPSNWKVTVANDTKDTSVKYISIETPPSSIENDKGATTTGKVIILIRPKLADVPELSGNDGSIAQDSQQLAYAKPSANQHQYPYVSFVHFGGTRTSKNPFEEVFVTGSTMFKASDNIGTGNVAGVDPLISAAFYQCPDTTCAGKGTGPLSITDSVWQNNDVAKKVKALIESLVIN